MIDLLDLEGERRVLLAEDDRQRALLRASEAVEVVVDRLDADGVEHRNLRLRPRGGTLHVSLAASSCTRLPTGWGVLAHTTTGALPRTLWLPREPRSVLGGDPAGRLGIEPVDAVPRRHLSATGLGWELAELGPDSWWSLPLLVMDDPDRSLHSELERASARQWPALLKSDWFHAASPAGLWDALVDGAIFDPRPCAWSPRRVRCQQCALAWWSYLDLASLDFASRPGDSPLWRSLARVVAWSVRVQLEEPQGWCHGLWREEPETHVRFLVDGVNLLLCEASASGESAWLAAAERAMRDVVARFSDELPGDGLWLLHDSIEAEAETPPEAAPRLGQRDGSVLCLNTHLQALAALARLARLQPDAASSWAEGIYERGMTALRQMLELGSAPILYRGLDNFVPSVVESRGRDGLGAWATRALFLRLLRKPYWWLRRSRPRFVHPNGFIERDMASAMLADHYHVLNLKDLLVLYALDPRPWLEPSIRAGVGFLRGLDLESGLARSPMFVEAVEVFRQYGQLFDAGAAREADRAADTVRAATGGASLDDAFWSAVGLERAIGPLLSARA